MAESLPPPAQLFLGPEEGQKADAIEKVAAALASRNGEPPEIHRFYAFESRGQEILAALRNKSLFARHRLVIVSNAEVIKRRDDTEALVEYLKAPAEDATLLLVSSELTREIDKKLAAAVPKECQRVFWEMFDNQKAGWIVNFFRQRKITIEQAAVDFLLDMIENNTRDLRSECERLALFFGPGAAVGLESVEHYIYHSKEENVFTLFDQVSARNLLSAEEILEKILLSREADATQLVSGLLWQFRRLAAFKRLIDENYDNAEAFTKSNITTKKAQRTYIDGNKNYSRQELEDVILLLAEFDSRFRSVKADLHSLLLHLMLYYIVMRGGRGSWRPLI
jgi:DNA polymerase-3 subunit delta